MFASKEKERLEMNLREHYLQYKKIHREKDRPVTRRMLLALMQNIDFESTLLRLGISAKPCSGKDEYCGFCPDHEMYKGTPPSDPKWYINSRTGLSYCQTESRGSNLIEIAKHILGLQTNEEAFEKLFDGKPVERKFAQRINTVPEKEELPDQEKLKKAIEYAEPIFDQGKVSEECIAYFEHDHISYETLRKFGVVSCEYGKYKNRALIPFLGEKLNLAGYIAIDYLGREEWAKQHSKYYLGIDASRTFDELYPLFLKKYRKTVYAPGFLSRRHLYGFYENLSFLKNPPAYLVLVEGERDALKLIQEGIPCVSIHGTYVKEEQRILLKSSGIIGRLQELFLGFDMDEAGNKAVENAFELFRKEMDADRIYSLIFPDGKDPKKFCRGELLSIIQMSRKQKIRTRNESA